MPTWMSDISGLIDAHSPDLWFLSYVCLEILAVTLVIDAVMKSRTSQGAVAWSVALIAMPLVVVPAYLMFGQRRFQGYVRALREGNIKLRQLAQFVIAEMHAKYQPQGDIGSDWPSGKVLEQLATMPFTRGNETHLLVDGEQTFNAIFDAIEQAKDYILVQFYILRDDRLGVLFQQKLIERAAAGVRIYLMYDSIGSYGLSRRYRRQLHRAGIKAVAFRTKPINFLGRLQINFRNHRKIVVVDGEKAFLGGLNVGDEYLGRHRRLTPWRDTHLVIQGPAVQAAQLCFLEDWHWLTDTLPALNWRAETRPANQTVLVLPTGPADETETCQLMFVQAINSAQSRLWIVSPYFVPDEPVMKAIKLAAFRGVDVRILIPGLADRKVVQLSGYAHVVDTDIDGVSFFSYDRGFLHQKVLLVDNDTTCIGSANLDNRSFRLNFELTVITRDRAFASEVEEMLVEDFSHSHEISSAQLLQRSYLFLVAARMARLFSPLQ